MRVVGLTASEDVAATVRKAVVAPSSSLPFDFAILPDVIMRAQWVNPDTYTPEMTAGLSAFSYDADLVRALSAELTNATPSVLDIDEENSVFVGREEGLGVIRVESDALRQYIHLQFSKQPRPGNLWYVSVAGYAAGTLGRYLWDTATSMVAGKTASSLSRALYVNNTTWLYADRNPDLFASGFDLTPISCHTNGGAANNPPGLLITRRHIVSAYHYQVGSPIAWLGDDDQYHTASVVRTARIGSTDIRIAYLDKELPESVSHFKVFPPNWRMNYAPSLVQALNPETVMAPDNSGQFRWTDRAVVPVFTKGHNFGNNPLWIEALQSGTSGFSVRSFVENVQYPTGQKIKAWDHDLYDWGTYPVSGSDVVQGGDSGSPTFVWIYGEPVLIGCRYTAPGGPALDAYHYEINIALNSTKDASDPTVYALDVVDLSPFTYFVA